MDKDLLKSLDNLSQSLTNISESIKSGGDSMIRSALSSGDLSVQLKEISINITQIVKKSNNILNVQNEILSGNSKILESIRSIDINPNIENLDPKLDDISNSILESSINSTNLIDIQKNILLNQDRLSDEIRSINDTGPNQIPSEPRIDSISDKIIENGSNSNTILDIQEKISMDQSKIIDRINSLMGNMIVESNNNLGSVLNLQRELSINKSNIFSEIDSIRDINSNIEKLFGNIIDSNINSIPILDIQKNILLEQLKISERIEMLKNIGPKNIKIEYNNQLSGESIQSLVNILDIQKEILSEQSRLSSNIESLDKNPKENSPDIKTISDILIGSNKNSNTILGIQKEILSDQLIISNSIRSINDLNSKFKEISSLSIDSKNFSLILDLQEQISIEQSKILKRIESLNLDNYEPNIPPINIDDNRSNIILELQKKISLEQSKISNKIGSLNTPNFDQSNKISNSIFDSNIVSSNILDIQKEISLEQSNISDSIKILGDLNGTKSIEINKILESVLDSNIVSSNILDIQKEISLEQSNISDSIKILGDLNSKKISNIEELDRQSISDSLVNSSKTSNSILEIQKDLILNQSKLSNDINVLNGNIIKRVKGLNSQMESGQLESEIDQVSESILNTSKISSNILDTQKEILISQSRISDDIGNIANKKYDIVYKKEKVENVTNTTESLGKENKKSESFFGSIKDKTKDIKSGISTIVLIAAGVLAVGMAFKLIGSVDIKSVLALSIALPLVALSFKKISEIGISYSDIPGLLLVTAGISTAILVSSLILSNVKTVGLYQALTSVLIAGVFTGISYGVGPLMKGIKGVSVGDALKSSLIIPTLMIALSGAIAGSSYLLGMVKPIGLYQALTSVLIAGVFTGISYGVGPLMKGMKGITIGDALKSSLIIPTLMIALSGAIAGSSYLLGMVKPIGIFQALTSILIAGVFTVVSYGIGKMLRGFKGISQGDAIKASITMPILLVALSGAIAGSSHLLGMVKPIGVYQALTSVLISGVFILLSYSVRPLLKGIKGISLTDISKGLLVMVSLSGAIALTSHIIDKSSILSTSQILSFIGAGMSISLVSLAMAGSISLVNKMGDLSSYVKGSLSIVAISGSIYLSSVILSNGDYSNSPSVDWSLNTGLSLAMFGIGALLLGTSAMTPMFWVGLGAIVATSLAVTASSHILNSGNYDKSPPVDWSLGTGLSLAMFGIGAVSLGVVILTGVGALALAAGLASISIISSSIVESDSILSKGKYTKYPNLDWVLGVGGSLSAFSVGVALLGILPRIIIRDGVEAISNISDSIVLIGEKFSKSTFSGGPKKEWSESVSISLSAFSPIYSMLMKNGIMKIFGGGGVGPDDFSKAIVTITEGIVVSAAVFSKFKSSFEDGPKKEWAEGVGLSLGAFSPIYSMLVKNQIMKIFGGGISSNDFSNAIVTITEGIIISATVFSKFKSSFTDAPSDTWAKGVGTAIGAFAPVFDILSNTSSLFNRSVSGSDLKNAIMTVSNGIIESGIIFSENKVGFDVNSVPGVEWSKAISESIISFSPVFDFVSKNSGWFGADSGDIKESILNIADSIKEFSVKISNGKYTSIVPSEFLDGISATVKMFSSIIKSMEDLDIDIDDGVDNINDIIEGIKEMSESSNGIKQFKPINFDNLVESTKSVLYFSKFMSKINESVDLKSTIVNGIFGSPVGKISKMISESFEDMSSIKVKKIDFVSINSLSNSLSVISESISSIKKINFSEINTSEIDDLIDNITKSLLKIPSKFNTFDLTWMESLGKIDSIDFDTNKMKEIISSINELGNIKTNSGILDWSNNLGQSIQKIKSSSDILKSMNIIDGQFSGLDKISDSFDKLSRSVNGFDESLSNIDSNKISQLNSLSGSSVVVKLANDDKINDLIKIFDSGSDRIVNAIDSYNSKKSDNNSIDRVLPIVKQQPNLDNKDLKDISDKFDLMTSILSDIATVVGSKGSLKNYILSIQNDISIGRQT